MPSPPLRSSRLISTLLAATSIAPAALMSERNGAQHGSTLRAGARGHTPMRLLVLTCLALTVSLIGAAGAWAAPTHDDFASATQVAALPFTDTVDAATATTESGEPQSCYTSDHTVWYAITPSQDQTLAADTLGSTAYGQITAYRADGSGLGGLSFLSCANFGAARAVFEVQAGQTYYVQASSLFGAGGSLRVHLEVVSPPPNDDFASAKTIGSTPFSDSVDLLAATAQPSEPTNCQGIAMQATAWYAFTPSESGSYVLGRSDYGPLAAYTGSSLSSLTRIACAYGATYFHADAGTTYYLQIASPGGTNSPAQLSLNVAPAATASFYHYPSDPSMFDTVQFIDSSYDPAGIGSRTWRLGDGFTTSDCCPAYRYAADGDYTAQLAITTTDGRTASDSHVVHVKTHDVAISKFSVPKTARVGQTKQLSVGITNTRSAQTVQVTILRSIAGGGFEQVGQVTQGVPVRAGSRTTSFSIGYTFSAEDATLGKVSFQAVATILTARDAHPADNTVTALPTKVTN